MQQTFKVRDKRQKGWFWLDNDYLNGYAKYFGAIGTAIYVSLCRHADNDSQKCFPAQETIAGEVGITDRTVRTYIQAFKKYGLIAIERERHPKTSKWLNNVYYLRDKSEWAKPEEIISCGSSRGKKQQKPEETDDTTQRNLLPIKETHGNKTHKKETHLAKQGFAGNEINPLIEKFKSINPSYERLFSNKTQRAALERLVAKWGREELERLFSILPQTNAERYAPTITTPIELENNMGRLMAFLQREKGKRSMIINI